MNGRLFALGVCGAVMVSLLFFGCTKKNPNFCDTNDDCKSVAAPVCDVDGTLAGTANECIAAPPAVDAGNSIDASNRSEFAVVLTGAGEGRIVSDDGTIDCPGQCSASFTNGTRLALSATASDRSVFATWGAPCADAESACDVTVGQSATIDARFERQFSLNTGNGTTCALLPTANVRCWGVGPALGYGNTEAIGDDEPASAGGDLDLGGAVLDIAIGVGFHNCALLETGDVRCWGAASRLGYPGSGNVGDDELPSAVGPVRLGATATAVAVGGGHTCALLEGGFVRCWGLQIANGTSEVIGDDEHPGDVSVLAIGGVASAVVTGDIFSCALLESGDVRCWGFGNFGVLGYGNEDSIGDNETPAAVGPVSLGGTVTQLAAGSFHSCALLTGGVVRCWGQNDFGQLGLANTNSVGDNEVPTAVAPVDVGGAVAQLAAGCSHTCALLESGAIRCWGDNQFGQLGMGNTSTIGDDEAPSSVTPVQIGAGTVVGIAAGCSHTCAHFSDQRVRCWGSGALGYGDTDVLGDNEPPSSKGDVPYL